MRGRYLVSKLIRIKKGFKDAGYFNFVDLIDSNSEVHEWEDFIKENVLWTITQQKQLNNIDCYNNNKQTTARFYFLFIETAWTVKAEQT